MFFLAAGISALLQRIMGFRFYFILRARAAARFLLGALTTATSGSLGSLLRLQDLAAYRQDLGVVGDEQRPQGHSPRSTLTIF